MEKLSFKVYEFEGPLDLLLYLIKVNKVSIYDIPIVEITRQYTDYLNEMREMDLDIASEFLIMASELLLIKSKMLLPAVKNEEGEVIDPRTELMEKLLDYQKYKELSEYLKGREDIGRLSFVKGRERIKGIPYTNDDLDVSVSDLVSAFNDLVERMGRKLPPPPSSFKGIVEKEKVNLKDRIDLIISYVEKHKDGVDFDRLFLEHCSTKAQLVVTFMGVLELIKLNAVSVVRMGERIKLKYTSG